VIADIPGLIEGASEGRGLGDQFLAHVERCGALLHLVDGTSETIAGDFHVIEAELDAYGHGLADKPRLVALSKIDALDADAVAARLALLRAAGAAAPIALSAASGAGVPEALRLLRRMVRAQRAAATDALEEPAPWAP